MTEVENLYCKIFVDFDGARDALVAIAAGCCAGAVHRDTVVGRRLELDVDDNDDFVERRKRADPDDFIRYRYFFDVEPASGAERAQYVADVGVLLTCLWSKGMKAVAACDFEDELPKMP